jgi:uncharacterized protein (TIGR02145 family)
MKKTFFFFTMFASIAASATVTVTPLTTDYAAQKVTFKVEWTNTPQAPYNNRVWVWVDLCPVSGSTAGTFQKAILSEPTATNNGVLVGSLNGRGFFVTITPATVTVKLDNATGKFNWCAYGSDYPPNMVMDGQIYYFKGTPPFILKEANGTLHEITQTSLPKANLTFVPVSITDETGYPGGLKEVIGTCLYTGTDWYADLNHKCQQRTSGAQNWEAWIKDTRDNELYRIVLMPNNKWWSADNIRYTKNNTIGTCSNNDVARCATPCGRWYNPTEILDGGAWSTSNPSTTRGICPVNWHIPSAAETNAMLISLTETTDVNRLIALKTNNTIAPLWTVCVNTGVLAGSDRYGFSMFPCGHSNATSRWTTDGYYKHADGSPHRMFFVERQKDYGSCLIYEYTYEADANNTPVRCIRN